MSESVSVVNFTRCTLWKKYIKTLWI